jgi:hypothetical protein
MACSGSAMIDARSRARAGLMDGGLPLGTPLARRRLEVLADEEAVPLERVEAHPRAPRPCARSCAAPTGRSRAAAATTTSANAIAATATSAMPVRGRGARCSRA